jgi:hypothetical protein
MAQVVVPLDEHTVPYRSYYHFQDEEVRKFLPPSLPWDYTRTHAQGQRQFGVSSGLFPGATAFFFFPPLGVHRHPKSFIDTDMRFFFFFFLIFFFCVKFLRFWRLCCAHRPRRLTLFPFFPFARHRDLCLGIATMQMRAVNHCRPRHNR